MDSLLASYRDDDDDDNGDSQATTITTAATDFSGTPASDPPSTLSTDPPLLITTASTVEIPPLEPDFANTTAAATSADHSNVDYVKDEPMASEEQPSSDDTELRQQNDQDTPQLFPNPTAATPKASETEEDEDDEDQDQEEEPEDDDEDPPPKKQKQLSLLTPSPRPQPSPKDEITPTPSETTPLPPVPQPPKTGSKSSKKKKNNNVWTKPASRKGKKKQKNGNNGHHANGTSKNNLNTPGEDTVLITPIFRFPDKNDDSPDAKICLSKVNKAEKVEISEDRLSAGSTKGYRMVRATRGVSEGAWYYEIKVVKLGETGHTRLGWSTDKGDVQAPVGYDGNSFGYRDIDGSKVHKALREQYGEEGYKEGDVIGFYINLPNGNAYMPIPPKFVLYKGQRYVHPPDAKDDPPKVVPGSEISFFRNGVCQGTAFKDLYGDRYYPAASMYTLPNQPNCVVKFNFGPDFEFFPNDFGGRPVPRPMIEVPYHGYDGRVENGLSDEKKQ